MVAPASKLSTLAWWADTTLGADLGVAAASTDQVYAAMDWLAGRQDQIEAKLAARHLAPEPNPARMALFDLSSSWLEGRHCPLAARGYSRDGKKGKLQIEYGLLTDPEGRPAAVRVFPGNTADPAAFTAIVDVVRDKFGLEQMVMVGDRGMITTARIAALNQREDGTGPQDAYGWITALRAPAIKKLMADGGPLQLSLFDQQNLAEISHPDYPGERLIACRNPVLAADRARTRSELLAATEKLLAPIITRVQAGRLAAPADRRRRRQSDQQVQDRQALPGHHHRHQPHSDPRPGPDRRRSRPGHGRFEDWYKTVNEPRYVMQQMRRNTLSREMVSAPDFAARMAILRATPEYDGSRSLRLKPVGPSNLTRDWNVDVGRIGVGAGKLSREIQL